LFNKAIGSFAFPVVVALAVFGAICGRRKFWGAIYYALLWMWLPVLALLVISYLITPLLVERYALSCFVAFFFLAALGTCLLSTARLRLGALAVVVILTLSHVYAYSRKPHDAQWREATATALRSLTSEGKVAVAPDYAISVVTYYLPVDKRSLAVPWSETANNPFKVAPKVLILGDQGTYQDSERLRADYPRLVHEFRGVQVRSR
jgi:hypothetical protein